MTDEAQQEMTTREWVNHPNLYPRHRAVRDYEELIAAARKMAFLSRRLRRAIRACEEGRYD